MLSRTTLSHRFGTVMSVVFRFFCSHHGGGGVSLVLVRNSPPSPPPPLPALRAHLVAKGQ